MSESSKNYQPFNPTVRQRQMAYNCAIAFVFFVGVISATAAVAAVGMAFSDSGYVWNVVCLGFLALVCFGVMCLLWVRYPEDETTSGLAQYHENDEAARQAFSAGLSGGTPPQRSFKVTPDEPIGVYRLFDEQ